ncbi:hypothetical protein GCM10028857_07640 [Salinarchaeum chitinilyticum]
MNSRGLTPVLGLVLLVGITAVASMALFLVGLSLADATQSSAEHEQAEQSMAQLAVSGDVIAAGESNHAEFDIMGTDSGTVRAISDTGTLSITVTNRTNDEQLLTMERSLGAIVYEASDGTEIAYQGGGVWRKGPSGASSLVRSPEFHYRATPAPTITFPIVTVNSDFSTSGDTTGTLVQTSSNDLYPDRPDHYNPLQDGSVLIQIESEYCEGWEEYFRSRTEGSAAEDCDDGEKGVLEIQFSVPFELDGIEGGVMLGDGNGNPEDFDGIDDPDEFGDSDSAPSATPMVEAKLEEAKSSGNVLPDDGVIDEPGLYYDDGNLSSGSIEFNTSAGDIEIASDQYPVFDGSVTITGDNNVTVYSRKNLVSKGGGDAFIGTPAKSSQLRVFVHSDVDQVGHKGQNTDFHGLLYAPNSQVLLFRGNNNASGALVAESADIGNTKFDIDPELVDFEFFETIGDAPFYYLHLSETTIEVEDVS